MAGINKQSATELSLCVAGAGAIGLTLAARLRLGGHRVGLLARGESLAAIRNRGVRLMDREGEHNVAVEVGDATDFRKQDILFLCPKSQDMPAMAADVQPLVGPKTMIVPVINGIPWWYFDSPSTDWNGQNIETVDPDGILKRRLPSRQIIGTTTMITAERLQPGVAITFNSLQMTIGELDDQESQRLGQLSEILTRSGIETRITTRIRDAAWTKVARNLISNPVSAITGATLRENFGNTDLARISHQMLYEVLPVIAAFGARLEIDPDEMMLAGQKMGDVKTSMLQDLERGSPLELASICDAVIELAQMHGIHLPVTQAITGLARFKSHRGMRTHAA